MDLKRRDEIVTLLRQAGAANDEPAPQITIHEVNITLKLDGRALLALLRKPPAPQPKK